MTPAQIDPATMTDLALAAALRSRLHEVSYLRTLRAEALRRAPVKTLAGGDYVVASRSTAGAWWLVEWSAKPTCTCPASVPRCWHVRQVERFCQLTDAARPTPPPNISALVEWMMGLPEGWVDVGITGSRGESRPRPSTGAGAGRNSRSHRSMAGA